MAEGNPMFWDLPYVGGQVLDVLVGMGIPAVVHLRNQSLPVIGLHSSGEETNQGVIIFFGEVICQLGKGLASEIRYIPVREIMVKILGFHFFFLWVNR